MNAMKVNTEPIPTKYAIAHQEAAGICLSGIFVPVAHVKAKRHTLKINICNPKLK